MKNVHTLYKTELCKKPVYSLSLSTPLTRNVTITGTSKLAIYHIFNSSQPTGFVMIWRWRLASSRMSRDQIIKSRIFSRGLEMSTSSTILSWSSFRTTLCAKTFSFSMIGKEAALVLYKLLLNMEMENAPPLTTCTEHYFQIYVIPFMISQNQ